MESLRRIVSVVSLGILAGSGYIGISKKITDESKRNLLRRHAKEICPAGMGLIVRTAAEAAGEEEFKRDLASLRRTMEVVEKRYLLEKGPALLYRDGDLAVKSLRDYLTRGVERILVDDREVWKRLSQMAEEEQDMSPDRILFFEERESLFQYFHVDSQIRQLFERVVPLPSGGTLVIDYTEALTVIDVNSGSFKGKGIPHDELAFLINRSAALEIARQIRLRGIGGIIMIDFIDMEKKEEKEKLVHILQAAVREDRVKTVVCGSRGDIGFVSQSGALGGGILNILKDLGIGFAQFISIGNQADVNAASAIEFWENEEDVHQILLYMESILDPKAFRKLATRVSKKKPILALKAGRSAAGASAASSHTGSLAGADKAADALLRQSV